MKKCRQLIMHLAVVLALFCGSSCDKRHVERGGREVRQVIDAFQRGWESPSDPHVIEIMSQLGKDRDRIIAKFDGPRRSVDDVKAFFREASHTFSEVDATLCPPEFREQLKKVKSSWDDLAIAVESLPVEAFGEDLNPKTAETTGMIKWIDTKAASDLLSQAGIELERLWKMAESFGYEP